MVAPKVMGTCFSFVAIVDVEKECLTRRAEVGSVQGRRVRLRVLSQEERCEGSVGAKTEGRRRVWEQQLRAFPVSGSDCNPCLLVEKSRLVGEEGSKREQGVAELQQRRSEQGRE